jgi:hypothetical protein
LNTHDKLFKHLVPKAHNKQLKRVNQTPKFAIKGTCFSTMTINYSWRTALHKDAGDYIDGYVFPLSSTPWLLSDESSTPNFILNQFPDAINISTYTGPVSWQGPDDAGVTQQQFYYHNKKLYTNFDMLENVQTLTVTYQFMCNGVKLKIELADFAKVNDYTLQLIGIKGLVNNVPNA